MPRDVEHAVMSLLPLLFSVSLLNTCWLGEVRPQILPEEGAWFQFSNESSIQEASPFTALTISSDGSRMVTAVRHGSLYVSDDAGFAWMAVPDTSPNSSSSSFWKALTSSYDGQHIFACQYDFGYVYSSSDYGATFSKHESLGIV